MLAPTIIELVDWISPMTPAQVSLWCGSGVFGGIGSRTYSPGNAFVVYDIRRHVYADSASLHDSSRVALSRLDIPSRQLHHQPRHLYYQHNRILYVRDGIDRTHI